MDKAEEFVKDLCEKNVLGQVAGWCYSVEHQKRGLFFSIFSDIYTICKKIQEVVFLGIMLFSIFYIFRGLWPWN